MSSDSENNSNFPSVCHLLWFFHQVSFRIPPASSFSQQFGFWTQICLIPGPNPLLLSCSITTTVVTVLIPLNEKGPFSNLDFEFQFISVFSVGNIQTDEFLILVFKPLVVSSCYFQMLFEFIFFFNQFLNFWWSHWSLPWRPANIMYSRRMSKQFILFSLEFQLHHFPKKVLRQVHFIQNKLWNFELSAFYPKKSILTQIKCILPKKWNALAP